MKGKQGGKVFLIITIFLFILMGGITVYSGFQPYESISIWFSLIFLATNVIYVFINIKEGRRYYTFGFSLISVSTLIYIIIPNLL
jgi:hypothetical protein